MGSATYEMPSGPLEHSSLWRGADLSKTGNWIFEFTPAELNEIEDAMRIATARGLRPTAFGKEDFPLPGLRPVFDRWLHELEHGRGFALARGIPVERYTEQEAEVLFWGIGQHLGVALSQNADGHVLGHVKNLGLDINKTNIRGYQTTVELAYHNDQSDVIGLMCLCQAKSGGQSSLASVAAIHNQMMTERPDLLRELFRPFFIDRRGELGREDEDDNPYYAMPVLSYHKGLLTARYIRGYIMSAQRFPEVPRLTQRQIDALDLFDEIAKRPGFAFDFIMDPGDIQLANNYGVLHSRTSFEDYPEIERRRHLLRLWLAVPNSRELPPVFHTRFGTCESGAIRGGIPPGRRAVHEPIQEFELQRL